MAEVFKRKVSKDIGSTLTSVGSYTVPASTSSTAIGLIISNTTTSAIKVDACLSNGGSDYYLIKNTDLPVGSALVVIGGEQKIVMEVGDTIKVRTVTGNCDAILSILEIT